MPPRPSTPFLKFTEAAQHVFNLPKPEVEKVKANYPAKSRKPQKRK
jgi:hypothetical protein